MNHGNGLINVLVTYRWHSLSEAQVQRIRDVSPRLNVIYSRNEAEDEARLPDTDILYSIGWPKNIAEAKRLKWIQLLSAGYNVLYGSPVEASRVLVTTSTGIHGSPIAEFVLASMVILSRRLLQVFRTKDTEALWKDFAFIGRELRGMTIGIVGMGVIGREIARLAQCLGMHILCVDARERPWIMPEDRYLPEELKETPLSDTDPNLEVRKPEQLPWLLAESDFVVLTLPLTPATREMIGERELRMIKPTAYLINPARGALVNEPALIRALQEGWIAGAALDAFQTEPLPAGHPFYELPNVLLTPHMCAHTDRLWDRCVDVFCGNLERFLEGQPLLNRVHPPDL